MLPTIKQPMRLVVNTFGLQSKFILHNLQTRNFKFWPESNSTAEIFMPKRIDDRQLQQLPHTPAVHPDGVILPMKYPQADIEMRGPERIHNQLIYRQFGIIALGGGALQHGHLDFIQLRINKYLDFNRFFAIWRVDAPWKAVSKRRLGVKAGGGKAKVHHYETPVRAGRILIEVAGIGNFGEIERLLGGICKRMPLYSIPITQQMMDQLKEEKKQLDESNYNPFEYRTLLRQNFSNSQTKISPREVKWGGTYF